MTSIDVNAIEAAGRSAMAWTPETDDGAPSLRRVLTAVLPALAILAVTAVVLGGLLAP